MLPWKSECFLHETQVELLNVVFNSLTWQSSPYTVTNTKKQTQIIVFL